MEHFMSTFTVICCFFIYISSIKANKSDAIKIKREEVIYVITWQLKELNI